MCGFVTSVNSAFHLLIRLLLIQIDLFICLQILWNMFVQLILEFLKMKKCETLVCVCGKKRKKSFLSEMKRFCKVEEEWKELDLSGSQ